MTFSRRKLLLGLAALPSVSLPALATKSIGMRPGPLGPFIAYGCVTGRLSSLVPNQGSKPSWVEVDKDGNRQVLFRGTTEPISFFDASWTPGIWPQGEGRRHRD